MALSILVFAYGANTMLPRRSTRSIIAASILPVALLLIDVLLCGYWERFKGLRTSLAQKNPWLGSLRSLNFFLAVLPVSIVAAISVVNPIFLQRGTLIFAPYLLIVLASGLATLLRRDRRWVAIALILAIIHGFSLLHFKSKFSTAAGQPVHDYKALAEQWVSQGKGREREGGERRGERGEEGRGEEKGRGRKRGRRGRGEKRGGEGEGGRERRGEGRRGEEGKKAELLKTRI